MEMKKNSPKVLIIHGPNLNLLGKREPHIYGKTTLGDINDELNGLAQKLGLEIDIFQSNHEHCDQDYNKYQQIYFGVNFV